MYFPLIFACVTAWGVTHTHTRTRTHTHTQHTHRVKSREWKAYC